MSLRDESTRDILIRIDTNLKKVMDDYMTKSKTDLAIEKAFKDHTRHSHKVISIASIVSLFTAVSLVVAALLKAFG